MINYVVSNGCSWMEQHNNERDLAKHFALKYNICTEADHNNNRHINLCTLKANTRVCSHTCGYSIQKEN